MLMSNISHVFFVISLNRERVSAIKFLFGVREDSLEDFYEVKQIEELISLLEAEASYKSASENHPMPHQVFITLLLILLVDEGFFLILFFILFHGCLDQGDCKLINAFNAKNIWHGGS